MKSDYLQSPDQTEGKNARDPASKVFNPTTYPTEIKEKLTLSRVKIFKFHADPDGLGNLEYLVANDGDDLARDVVSSFLITPEEKAFKYLNEFLIPILIPFHAKNMPRVFLKHTTQSWLGTHCIFGLQYQGFEIDEHFFSVHIDKNNHIVMVCSIYLPNLLELFGPSPDKTEFEDVPKEKVDKEIENLTGTYDRANGEKFWLIIWNENISKYEVAPGEQVKLSLSEIETEGTKSSNVVCIPAKNEYQTRHTNNSPGLAEKKVGLGKIIHNFIEVENDDLSILNDDNLENYKAEAILQDLESTAELNGQYAAIRDKINPFVRDKKGIFINEAESFFDRVTAYYYLDYIQKYFRSNLGFQLLEDYPHLNPVRLVLSKGSVDVARYSVNDEKIIFYKLGNNNFTAVRDPRLVYHEFVHVVTDAIARLPRAGEPQPPTPRSKEILQAQAIDEGMADYFASSLAERQGAKKAQAYYLKDGGWGVVRDLNPGPDNEVDEQEPIKVEDLNKEWRKKKYKLGEFWGRWLWRLRKPLGAEITDILVAYSIFFLSRWATFEQGFHALLLADRLLFSAKHRDTIEKHKEVIEKIEFI